MNPQFELPKQKMQINVSLDQMEDVKCECGCSVFIPGLKFKKLSALLSETGKEQTVLLETVVCTRCFKELTTIGA